MVRVYVLLLFSFFSVIAQAIQPIAPDVSAAFNYISTQQQSDGSFTPASPITTNYHSSARVGQSLAHYFALTAEFSQVQAYISGEAANTTEDLSRRIFLGNYPSDISTILAAQNTDGGFGAEAGFSSNILDTALALSAMRDSGMPVGAAGHNLIIPAGGSYVAKIDVPADALMMTILVENLTGSIEVRIAEGAEPGPSSPYFTISSPNTFIQLTPSTSPQLVPGKNYIKFTAPTGSTISFTVDYQTASQDTAASTSAMKYLLAGQNTDGGWGFNPNDDDSRLYYTFWSVNALRGNINPVQITSYITGKEVSGGGFSDLSAPDVFTTSVAIMGLATLGQNVATLVPDSVTYIETAQQLNGSFSDDPFITAWGMDALLASHAPIAPNISSNGGGGVGQGFITNLGTTTISGFAPVGATGISVNSPSAIVNYDPATGMYSITLNLSEGVNDIQISAYNLSGLTGTVIPIQVTRNSALITQGLNLIPGLNQIGLSLNPANSLTAQGLLELLGGNATEVQHYNVATGQFDSVKTDGIGGYIGSDFALAGLDGINVIVNNLSATNIVGSVINPATVDLVPGVNAITIPNPPTGLDAAGLLALIGDETVVSSIQRFNTLTGDFESALYSGGVVKGKNFPIESGIAYYVHMRTAITGFVLPVNVDVSISIASPLDGATVTTSPITVSGTVSGAPPLSVTVNGVVAVVTGNTYSASIPLTTPGATPITATVVDNTGANDSVTISINYNPVDFTLPIGSSISGTASFSTTPAVITQVAFYTQSITGLPAGVTYTTDTFNLYGDGTIQAGFTIAATGSALPGIYTFQVEYGLLDAGSNPLGPLSGNIYVFKFEIVP